MMMIGAMDVALGGKLGYVKAGIITIIPIIIFIILCFTAKSNTQVSSCCRLAIGRNSVVVSSPDSQSGVPRFYPRQLSTCPVCMLSLSFRS